ncbi:MAG: HAD family hydrolase [Clostridiales bacterium]|nr:HAD family hydrolase [Clostridiales bacterium]
MDSIIFDVDGTLWDSTEVVAQAWTQYLRQTEQLDMHITSRRLMELFGRPLPDIAARIFPEKSQAEQLRIIDGCCEAEHQALLQNAPPLYPHLEETLKSLSEKYPLFIVSNCQAGYIEVFLKVTGFAPFFRDHLCPGDTGEEKAANIREIIQRHHLSSPVYVGDTEGDFLACREAGVPFVFASYGFGRVKEPDFCIGSLPDLLRLP